MKDGHDKTLKGQEPTRRSGHASDGPAAAAPGDPPSASRANPGGDRSDLLAVARADPHRLPYLLIADEVASLLRSSRKAIFVRIERGQIPGVTRIGRRIYVRRDVLLRSLDEGRVPVGNRR